MGFFLSSLPPFRTQTKNSGVKEKETGNATSALTP
jgi:hypothetical protein